MSHDHHDMGSMTTAISSAMPAATSAASSMAGHNHGGGGANACKISMLWNWYTVDSCFLSRSWHITSKGMFAGSCIGVILLVMVLEFLRRAGKEYDRYIINQYTKSLAGASGPVRRASSPSSTDAEDPAKGTASSRAAGARPCAPSVPARFRPSLVQQAVRALLHMLQFAVAYFVMLLAMYYNGYIIICIFIGAYLGYFVFGWQSLSTASAGSGRLEEEVTVCCG